jgi:hypothetical protein
VITGATVADDASWDAFSASLNTGAPFDLAAGVW